MRNQCPCGSKKRYKNCCELIHKDHSKAQIPEQLMRARYSAYALGLIDFIINTYPHEIATTLPRKEIESGTLLTWTKLVIKSSSLSQNETEGFVHFKAFYIENGASYALEELSRFQKVNGLWFYVDGTFPESSCN
ncbi:YchJ family metal-binding protein [Vibrio sp.]|nr:YchJ family metal-binding protein [Vibrio viridaestus]MDC0609556.1 YchJ family metal-binding protein [Vibrio sp.]